MTLLLAIRILYHLLIWPLPRCNEDPDCRNPRGFRIARRIEKEHIITLLVMYISAASPNYRTCASMLSVSYLTRFPACCWSSCLVVSDELMRKSTIIIFILDSYFLTKFTSKLSFSFSIGLWIYMNFLSKLVCKSSFVLLKMTTTNKCLLRLH